MKTYYELLQVTPDAPAEQIKQAFRRIIARYHPDKVQHLGAEFQDLAQVRSAELTTAYKTLIDDARRAEYDETLRGGTPDAVIAAPPGPAAPPPAPEPAPPDVESDGDRPDVRFESLRSGRDVVLRRAALQRVDHVFHEAFAVSEKPLAPGFDLSYLSKPGLFDRKGARPWLLAKFVQRLDKRAVQQIRAQAARANASKKAAVSVFLLSGELANEREIKDVIATEPPPTHPEHPIVIIPVDVRDWHALVPKNADPATRSLAARLRAS